MSATTQSKPRKYRKITPDTVARFETESVLQGNGTAAVRVLEPDRVRPDLRAAEIKAKQGDMTAMEVIEVGLEQMAGKAIAKVEELIGSSDGRIATKNAHFAIEHVRGKAVQRTENKNYNLNIQTVLE